MRDLSAVEEATLFVLHDQHGPTGSRVLRRELAGQGLVSSESTINRMLLGPPAR